MANVAEEVTEDVEIVVFSVVDGVDVANVVE